MVEAALEIIDEQGVQALSMRSLARRLSASTATLYRHFGSRAELIAAVVDRVLGEVDVDPERLAAKSWRQACWDIGVGYFEALRRHRNVALLLADQAPTGPNAALIRERWLAAMLDHGFPMPVAARSGATIAHYVEGFGLQLGGQRATGNADDAELPAAMLRLDPSAFPATAAALAARSLPIPLEEEFAFGLELILDGLSVLLGGEVSDGGVSRTSGPPPPDRTAR